MKSQEDKAKNMLIVHSIQILEVVDMNFNLLLFLFAVI